MYLSELELEVDCEIISGGIMVIRLTMLACKQCGFDEQGRCGGNVPGGGAG